MPPKPEAPANEQESTTNEQNTPPAPSYTVTVSPPLSVQSFPLYLQPWVPHSNLQELITLSQQGQLGIAHLPSGGYHYVRLPAPSTSVNSTSAPTTQAALPPGNEKQ